LNKLKPSLGMIFVLSAPAGTGKTTLVRMLCEEFSQVVQSISCTTRLPRPQEVPGKDYRFITEKEFEAKMHAGDFLEHAKVFDHYYGTSKEDVLSLQKSGKHVFLVIDTQGALQLKKSHFPAIFIFVSPPSLAVLKERLKGRKTEKEAWIEQRLSWAQKEMEAAPLYDYHIINDELLHAYDILRSIVIAEEHRTRRKHENET